MRRLLLALALIVRGAVAFAFAAPPAAVASADRSGVVSWTDASGRLHVREGGLESVYQWSSAFGWQLLYTTTYARPA